MSDATGATPGDALAGRLAKVFAVLGPLYRRTARTVESAEPVEGVSVGVRAVLEILQSDGRMPVPRIAESLVLSRQFVQRMTNDARTAGLVQLHANPRHKRSPIVALTNAGRERIQAIKTREHKILAAIAEPISPAQLDACLHVLRTLDAAVLAAGAELPPDLPDDGRSPGSSGALGSTSL